MSAAAIPGPQQVPTSDLRQALERNLASLLPGRSEIACLERTPSLYGSSFPLEELTVTLADGGRLELVFKNLSPRALSAGARRARPEFLDEPLREIEVYRQILQDGSLGTPLHYGSVADAQADRYWLFVERVAGRELYQVGEFALWQRVARWLAGLHHRFSDVGSLPQPAAGRLLRCDGDYFGIWIERAIAFRREPALHRLARHYSRVVRELSHLPVALIHGEFYASNVLVQAAPSSRVCAVDWERAAIGSGLIDLAALVAGTWTEPQKQELVLAYRDELQRIGSTPPGWEALLRGVDLCRLHLAVQWLGWSPDWTPPREHRQDWLTEAVGAARRLGYTV